VTDPEGQGPMPQRGAFRPSAYRGQHASPVLLAAGSLGSALFTLRCRPKYVYNFNLRDVGHKLRPVNDRTAQPCKILIHNQVNFVSLQVIPTAF